MESTQFDNNLLGFDQSDHFGPYNLLIPEHFNLYPKAHWKYYVTWTVKLRVVRRASPRA